MSILGVDPGIAKLGWALLTPDGADIHAAGVIRTATSDGTDAERLQIILAALKEVIATHPEEVTLLTVETQHAQGWTSASDDTAAVLREMRGRAAQTMRIAAVRGGVVGLAQALGIVVVEVSPQEGKKSLTGRGDASKQQMVEMVWGRFGEKVAQDAADAVGLALAGAQVVAGRQTQAQAVRQVRAEATAGLPEHVKRAIARGQGKGE